MTINLEHLEDGQRRYYIKTEKGYIIAWFDELNVAAIVLRYLKGVFLTQDERMIAHREMRRFDEAIKEGGKE